MLNRVVHILVFILLLSCVDVHAYRRKGYSNSYSYRPYHPRSYTYHPRSYTYHPRTYTYHPRSYSYHPRTYTYHPRSYTYHPRTYSYHPRSSGRRSSYAYSGSNGVIARDSRGRIKRSSSARHEFMRQTGYPNGRPGYIIDHIIPLKRGGCDCPENMQWQTKEEAKAKDKWE